MRNLIKTLIAIPAATLLLCASSAVLAKNLTQQECKTAWNNSGAAQSCGEQNGCNKAEISLLLSKNKCLVKVGCLTTNRTCNKTSVQYKPGQFITNRDGNLNVIA